MTNSFIFSLVSNFINYKNLISNYYCHKADFLISAYLAVSNKKIFFSDP